MRNLGLLGFLVLLASCGSPPEPRPRWQDPSALHLDAACERFPDWTDGLSLEELLICAENRGGMIEAIERTERAQETKDDTHTNRWFPFEVDGVPPSRREDRTTAGLSVRHVFDLAGRWEKRQGALTAEIANSRAMADERRDRLRERARCAYWTAVAAERRMAIEREGTVSLSIAGAQDPLVGAGPSLSGLAGSREPLAEPDGPAARAEIEALIGSAVPPGWTLSDPLPGMGPDVDLEEAISLARAHNSRLAALALAAAEARSRFDQLEAETEPDPGVGIGYSVAQDRNATGFDFRGDRALFAGFSISLSSRHYNRRRIAPASIEGRAAIRDRNAAEAEIVQEVTAAVRRYRVARDRFAQVVEIPRGLAGEPGDRPAKLLRLGAQLDFAIALSRLESVVGLPVERYGR